MESSIKFDAQNSYLKALKTIPIGNAQCVILVIFMNSAELRLEPPKFIEFEYYHLLIYNFFYTKS